MGDDVKLLPCPVCNGDAENLSDGGDDWYTPQYGCERCEVFARTVVKWNALPRPLVWSSERPKVVGLYAHRLKDDHSEEDAGFFTEEDIVRSRVPPYSGWYAMHEFAGPFVVQEQPK